MTHRTPPSAQNVPEKRPIRIGNLSGATGDHPHAMARMARSPPDAFELFSTASSI